MLRKRSVRALLFVVIVLVAGCTGTTTPTPDDESSPDGTPTVQATGTPGTPDTSLLTVTVVDQNDADSDSPSRVDLRIEADTRLPNADGENDRGEPFFVVSIDGEEVRRTDEVAHERSFETTISLDPSELSQLEPGSLTVTVTLVDEDVAFDDEVASWSGTVDYRPPGKPATTASPTVARTTTRTSARTRSPTPTRTPTRTRTPTPTPTTLPTPTPTPASTPTPTASPSPTPTSTPSRSERTEFQVTVVRVVDGDTVDVRYENGDDETIRLLGVDTPEVHTETDPAEWEGIPETDAGREHLRDWGHRASEFARTELEEDEVIRIVVDEEADRRGGYGRLLVYVYDDGELFNLELIQQGYARFYDASFGKRSEFEQSESTARSNDVGVWDYDVATATPTSTPDPGEGDLAVARIHEDAEGNDHENENDEYIVFENTGDGPLDLSGWRVEDEAGHSYTVPQGFTLGAGETVTLYTGSGTDTDNELYWGSDAAIWNNDGDTILVYDSSGTNVLEESYSG